MHAVMGANEARMSPARLICVFCTFVFFNFCSCCCLLGCPEATPPDSPARWDLLLRWSPPTSSPSSLSSTSSRTSSLDTSCRCPSGFDEPESFHSRMLHFWVTNKIHLCVNIGNVSENGKLHFLRFVPIKHTCGAKLGRRCLPEHCIDFFMEFAG